MPIPASPDGEGVTSAIAALFLQAHEQLRDALSGLDDEALNWVPTPGANSIATIVTHLVGSEAETLRGVAGLPTERDREAEFGGQWLTTRQVRELVDAADNAVVAVAPLVDPGRLEAVFPLPTLPTEESRPGLTWLVGNYGHAREHIGQIQLTAQLYGNGRSSAL